MRVPKNGRQRREADFQKKMLTPDTSFSIKTPCMIKQVWDVEESNYQSIPKYVQDLMERSPGTLFAQVELNNRRNILVRFKETPDQVYGTYGTSALLEGMRGMLEHRIGNLSRALLTPVPDSTKKPLDNKKASQVLSIGAVIGL